MEVGPGEGSARAVELCRQALLADPNFWKARSLLGRHLVRLGRIDEGIGQLREVVVPVMPRPGDGRALKALGDDFPRAKDGTRDLAGALQAAARFEEAAAVYKLHLEIHPNVAALVCLAQCCLELGRDRDVVELLEPLEELAVRSWTPGLLVTLGRAYQSLGRRNQALAVFRTEFGHRPADQELHGRLRSFGYRVVQSGGDWQLRLPEATARPAPRALRVATRPAPPAPTAAPRPKKGPGRCPFAGSVRAVDKHGTFKTPTVWLYTIGEDWRVHEGRSSYGPAWGWISAHGRVYKGWLEADVDASKREGMYAEAKLTGSTCYRGHVRIGKHVNF